MLPLLCHCTQVMHCVWASCQARLARPRAACNRRVPRHGFQPRASGVVRLAMAGCSVALQPPLSDNVPCAIICRSRLEGRPDCAMIACSNAPGCDGDGLHVQIVRPRRHDIVGSASTVDVASLPPSSVLAPGMPSAHRRLPTQEAERAWRPQGQRCRSRERLRGTLAHVARRTITCA